MRRPTGSTASGIGVRGLVTPDAGQVRLFGEPLVADRPSVLGRLNFAAGYVNLPGVLTVEENLRVFGRLYGVGDVAGRVERLVDQLDLGELRRRPLRLPADPGPAGQGPDQRARAAGPGRAHGQPRPRRRRPAVRGRLLPGGHLAGAVWFFQRMLATARRTGGLARFAE